MWLITVSLHLSDFYINVLVATTFSGYLSRVSSIAAAFLPIWLENMKIIILEMYTN